MVSEFCFESKTITNIELHLRFRSLPAETMTNNTSWSIQYCTRTGKRRKAWKFVVVLIRRCPTPVPQTAPFSTASSSIAMSVQHCRGNDDNGKLNNNPGGSRDAAADEDGVNETCEARTGEEFRNSSSHSKSSISSSDSGFSEWRQHVQKHMQAVREPEEQALLELVLFGTTKTTRTAGIQLEGGEFPKSINHKDAPPSASLRSSSSTSFSPSSSSATPATIFPTRSHRMILIQGPPGSGRTQLAQSLQRHWVAMMTRSSSTASGDDPHHLTHPHHLPSPPAVRFVRGKSDPLQTKAEPYAALVAALEEWTGLVVQQGSEAVRQVRMRLLQHLGDTEVGVLIGMIPALARILDPPRGPGIGNASDDESSNPRRARLQRRSSTAPDPNDPSAARTTRLRVDDSFQRFVFVFRKFLMAVVQPDINIDGNAAAAAEVAAPQTPDLILFLDDLQWADFCTVHLLLNLLLTTTAIPSTVSNSTTTSTARDGTIASDFSPPASNAGATSPRAVGRTDDDGCGGRVLFLATCDDESLVLPPDSSGGEDGTTIKSFAAQFGAKLQDLESRGYLQRMRLDNWDETRVAELLQRVLPRLEDEVVTTATSDGGDDLAPCPARERLNRLAYERSQGNLYRLERCLLWLHKADLLYRPTDLRSESHDEVEHDDPANAGPGLWTCDVEEVEMTLQTFQESFFEEQVDVADLPVHVRVVLQVAACLGPYFDSHLLTFALDFDVKAALQLAINQGWIVVDPIRRGYLFATDRRQRAAYELIPTDGRELFHLEVGRRIWRKLNEDGVDQYLYTILSQMRVGAKLISRVNEKLAVATLCLHAGRKSGRCSNFTVASIYFDLGLDLLGDPGWNDQYELTLALHNAAAESALCVTNFTRMTDLIERVLARARSVRDKIEAYSTFIYHLGASGHPKEALQVGLELLRALGEPLPSKWRTVQLLAGMMRVRRYLNGKSDEQLLRMPTMTDPDKLACLRMLYLVLLQSFLTEPMLDALIIQKMVALTVKHGASPFSSFAFASYGMLLTNGFGDVDGGYRYGKLGLKFMDRYEAQEYVPSVHAVFYGVVFPHKRPIRECLGPLLSAYKIGLQTGDIEAACLCGFMFTIHALESGMELRDVVREWDNMQEVMVAHHQYVILTLTKSGVQACHHHMGLSKDPAASHGNLMDCDAAIKEAKEKHQDLVVNALSLCQMTMCYIYNAYDAAERYTHALDTLKGASSGYEKLSAFFFAALLAVAQAREGRQVRKNLRFITKVVRWIVPLCQKSPHNCLDKAFLLRAELASYYRQHAKAEELYVCALALSEHKRSHFMVGHVNECLARHYSRRGDSEVARLYLTAAVAAYEAWGGVAKCRQLTAELRALDRTENPVVRSFRRISLIRN